MEWWDVISIQLNYWALSSLLRVLGWRLSRFDVRLGVCTGCLRVVSCNCYGLCFQLLYLRIPSILGSYVLFGGGGFRPILVFRASTRVGGGEREWHVLNQWSEIILFAEQNIMGKNLWAVREMCENWACFVFENR